MVRKLIATHLSEVNSPNILKIPSIPQNKQIPYIVFLFILHLWGCWQTSLISCGTLFCWCWMWLQNPQQNAPESHHWSVYVGKENQLIFQLFLEFVFSQKPLSYNSYSLLLICLKSNSFVPSSKKQPLPYLTTSKTYPPLKSLQAQAQLQRRVTWKGKGGSSKSGAVRVTSSVSGNPGANKVLGAEMMVCLQELAPGWVKPN